MQPEPADQRPAPTLPNAGGAMVNTEDEGFLKRLKKFFIMSLVLPTLILALNITTIAAAEWVDYSSTKTLETRWGVFKSCTGDTCTQYKEVQTASISLAGNIPGCSRSKSDFMDRMNVTAGLIIIGLIASGIVVGVQLLHVSGVTVIAKRGHVVSCILQCVASITTFIGIVVYGSTMSYWAGCGTDVCTQYDGTSTFCGVGYSYAFVIVGAVVFALSSVMILVYTVKPTWIAPTGENIFTIASLIIFGIVLTAIGVGTNNWNIVVPDYIISGLFKSCTTTTCTANKYDRDMSTIPGCTLTGDSFAGHNIAALVFLFVSAISVLVLLFASLKNVAALVLLSVVEVAQLIAFLLQEHLYDSAVLCGTSFCSYFTGYCKFGVSYAFLITSMVLTATLFTLHFFQWRKWCCFQAKFMSGREPFTVVAAVTTITTRTPSKPLKIPPPPSFAPKEEKLKERNAREHAHELRNPAVDFRTPNRGEETAQNKQQQQQQQQQPRAVGSNVTPPTASPIKNVVLPPGVWEFDTVSGYYWCEEVFLFYDPESRLYYDPATDQWINTENAPSGR